MTVPRVLVGGHQRGSLQYDVWIAPHLRDLLSISNEKGFDITAPSTQSDIITVRVSERRRPFYIVRDLMLREITTKSKLHRHASHNATQAIIRRAAHSVIRVSQ